MTSLVLGLEMRLLTDGRLRFFNPQTGEYLRDYAEERARGDREQIRADREQLEKEQERIRADRLAAKLRELGIDPDAD